MPLGRFGGIQGEYKGIAGGYPRGNPRNLGVEANVARPLTTGEGCGILNLVTNAGG